MKKMLVLFLLCGLSLAGCQKNNQLPLENTIENYTKTQAKSDGCVIFEDADIESGQAIWDEFITCTEEGKKAEVRLVWYYDDAYEVKDLIFNGKEYIIKGYEDGELIENQYQYLLHEISDGQPKSESSKVESVEVYYLVDDDTLTYHDLVWSRLSSSYLAFVEYEIVYQKWAYVD